MFTFEMHMYIVFTVFVYSAIALSCTGTGLPNNLLVIDMYRLPRVPTRSKKIR